MFTNESPAQEWSTDALITAYQSLQQLKPGSDEYNTLVTQIKTLSEVKCANTDPGLSLDTVVTGGLNIAGILLILHHERAHVIAGKAFTLVRKLF